MILDQAIPHYNHLKVESVLRAQESEHMLYLLLHLNLISFYLYR